MSASILARSVVEDCSQSSVRGDNTTWRLSLKQKEEEDDDDDEEEEEQEENIIIEIIA